MNGKQLKNSILQWAIQGKLVPQDPNDEPASVLLERIRAEKARLVKEKKIKKDKNESIIYRGDDNSYYEKFIATGEVKCIDEEIPFEIPHSWCWVRLGTITSIIGGYAFPSEAIKSENGHRVIRISDFNDGKMTNNKVVRYNGKADLAQYVICERDILMAMTGGTVGKSIFLTELPEKHMLLNQRVAIIRNNYLFDEYINLVIIAPITIEVVNSRKNSTNDNISMVDIYNFLIPVPPLIEQKRIVSQIKAVTPIAHRYGKSQETLGKLNADIFDKLKRSVLQEAIQGKLVPQIESEGTAGELLSTIRKEKENLVKQGKLKKSSLADSLIFKGDDNKYFEKIGTIEKDITDEIPFEIPNSWCWIRLNNLCNITNGFTPLRTEPKFWENGNINWFTVEDIRKQGEYIYQTTQKITELAVSKDRIVRAGSVLLCCTASVGQCAMTMIPTTTNQQFNALTIKEEYRCLVNDEFLYLFVKTLAPILHDLAGKTTFEFISVKKVGNILVPIPPVLEQCRICKVTNKAIASIMSR